MRPADRLHIAELMGKASHGELTRSDVVSLFMLLRGEAPNLSGIKDIGHTVAHDERTRGIAFDEVQRFVDEFRASIEDNTGYFVVRILYPMEQLIAELIGMASTLGIDVDGDGLKRHSRQLAVVLADVLDGTTYRLDGAFVRLVGEPRPFVQIQYKRPLAGGRLPQGVAVSVPLLWDDTAP